MRKAVLIVVKGEFIAITVGVDKSGDMRDVAVIAPAVIAPAVTAPRVVKAAVAVSAPVMVVGPVKEMDVGPVKEMAGDVMLAVAVPVSERVAPVTVVEAHVVEPSLSNTVASTEVVASDEIVTFPVTGTLDTRLIEP